MRVQLVDENDQLIGHKERSEIDGYADIFRVTALWVMNAKDEILIAQRKLTKVISPGKWGPSVSGTVEEGETYESNVYKEAEEEISLVGEQFEEGPKLYLEQPRKHFAQFYTVRVDKDLADFIPQEDEVEKLEWKSYDELATDVEKNPDNYVRTMAACLTVLSKGIK